MRQRTFTVFEQLGFQADTALQVTVLGVAMDSSSSNTDFSVMRVTTALISPRLPAHSMWHSARMSSA
jgi:hypothetical protein